MRELKHHEKKLLRKVDFFSWKDDQNIREGQIMRKYLLQDRYTYCIVLIKLSLIISFCSFRTCALYYFFYDNNFYLRSSSSKASLYYSLNYSLKIISRTSSNCLSYALINFYSSISCRASDKSNF